MNSSDMRLRAEKCRDQAASTRGSEPKRLLLDTAEDWDAAAEVYDKLRTQVLRLMARDKQAISPAPVPLARADRRQS